MSENTKTNKTDKTTKPRKSKAKVAKKAAPKTTKNGKKAGRPNYVPRFPTTAEWTLRDFMLANDVNPETGKSIHPKGSPEAKQSCSKLTLIKYIAKDSERMGHSVVKRLSKTSEPIGDAGLGRKPFVYTLRVKKSNTPATAPADAAPSTDITVPVVDITTATDAEPVEVPAPAAEPVTAEVPAEATV